MLVLSACEAGVTVDHLHCETTEECSGTLQCWEGYCVPEGLIPPAEGEAEAEAEAEGEPDPCNNPPVGEECDGQDDDACPDGVFVCDGNGGVACDDDLVSWNVETCNDGADNDCDGLADCDDADDCPAGIPECEMACATVTLYTTGETVGADGAPLFSLDAATPGGASIPGLGEVLRIRAEANPECVAVEVEELVVMIEFSDNASSGWLPQNVTLRTPDGAVIAGPTNDDNYEDPEPGVRIVHLMDPFILEPNAPLHLLVFADTFGAAVGSSADTVRASLIAPATWRVAFEGAPTLETADGFPVEGYTLFY